MREGEGQGEGKKRVRKGGDEEDGRDEEKRND